MVNAAPETPWNLTVGVLLHDEDPKYLDRYMAGVRQDETHHFPEGVPLEEVFEAAQNVFKRLRWEPPSKMEPLLFPNKFEKDPEVAIKLAMSVMKKVGGIDTLEELRAKRPCRESV